MLACLSYMCVCGFCFEKREDDFSLTSKYAQVLFITLGWFFMFYMFLFQQSYTHFCEFQKAVAEQQKKRDKTENINLMRFKAGMYENCDEVYVVNTIVRNTIEQSLTFLPLLWLCAVLGGDAGVYHATVAGWIWLTSRVVYPVFYRWGMPWFFISTLPGYGAQLYMAFRCLEATISRDYRWPKSTI